MNIKDQGRSGHVTTLPVGALRLDLGPEPSARLWRSFAELEARPRHAQLLGFGRRPRLLEAVEALAHHKSAPWLLEAHGPGDLQRKYLELLGKPAQEDVVVLYVSGDQAERPAAQTLQKARELLEAWGIPGDAPPKAAARADDASPLEAARRRREHLLATESFLDSTGIHRMQGGAADAPGAGNTASRLRRKGELLGVWNGREYLHPAFQCDPATGRLMPEVQPLLALLPKDRSGWRQAFWLYQPHARLGGKRPADVFPGDPDAVLEAARSTYQPDETNW
jgi:hypothetical protein